jgi:5-formyltetrahydrofolate cyclo-ligase
MVVPSPIPASAKSVLRAELRSRRKTYAASLSRDTRGALEAELVRWLDPLLASARIVAGYQPMASEISPLPMLARARDLGKQIAFPAFACRDSNMAFRIGEASEPGPWGMLQPSREAPAAHPDLVLVPLIGCDPAGNRIGMGQGHYDRALAPLRQNARLVGLGWTFQLLPELLVPDSWDQTLDAFVSPAGLTEF